MTHRVAYGDWQTPASLAEHVVRVVAARVAPPAVVLEPTCGRGTFLVAAAQRFPDAALVGYDRADGHLAHARKALAHTRASLHHADFFSLDWNALLAALPSPALVLGNPPWVTSATLGALASDNLPTKNNFKRHAGLDARTGRANFDISEWMILRLLDASRGRDVTLAMLCKSAVARRVLEVTAGWDLRFDGATWRIDAKAHFDAAVDAVLLCVRAHATPTTEPRWATYDSLHATTPSRHLGVLGGRVCDDIDAALRTRALEGVSSWAWRSGLKHDCAAVMELRRVDARYVNGLGEEVDIEPEHLFPLRKGSDLANRRARDDRHVIVTQRRLGDDTATLRSAAPKTWAYLTAHRERLAARRSSIYRGRGDFAMFGVGDYAFAPYKVAICGLYKRLAFAVVQPVEGRPVMLDDTSYFLPCDTYEQASALAAALASERAKAFFEARVSWDAKRPITRGLLQTLSLDALLREETLTG